jgi:DHA1 family multidrug resistance protein-like MFS transporter
LNTDTAISESTGNSWQRNLWAIFAAELLVMIGFSFVFPFLPLYIANLGSYSAQQASVWAGIAEGAGGIGMFISSPIWGMLADRYGKKPMVLRAMFGGAISVALLAIAPNVSFVIIMRFLQGVLSGTVAAASALVASMTPSNKRPFAMGMLMTAIYIGNSVGPLIGGYAADKLGFAATFIVTGGLLVSGGLIILFLVKEQFKPTTIAERISLKSVIKMAGSPQILPLLIIQFTLYAGPNMVAPIIPLLFQQLNPLGNVATAAGIAIAIAGALAGITAIGVGKLGERVPIKTILIICCFGTALAYIPPMFVTTVPQLTVFIALRGLINGGITTTSYTLLSLSVPENRQGVIFGLGQSATSLGSGIGPVIGGALGSATGLRYVFTYTTAMYLLATILIFFTLPKKSHQSL